MIAYYEKFNSNKIAECELFSTINIDILICTFNYMMNRTNIYVFKFSTFQR